jgi:hypothetical protein
MSEKLSKKLLLLSLSVGWVLGSSLSNLIDKPDFFSISTFITMLYITISFILIDLKKD